MFKPPFILIALILSSIFSATAQSSSTGDKVEFAYFTLAPDLTTNISTDGNRLAYLLVRIDLMVVDNSYVADLKKHEPLIRNQIIETISQKTEDQIKTLPGKEELRKQLIDSLNSLLLAETGKVIISDLLFTKYLYQ